jgi:hypothetical protein
MESVRLGWYTGQFGNWIDETLPKNSTWRVYYDHGGPDAHRKSAVLGFRGSEPHHSNRLADVDVLIAMDDQIAEVLIEIEENPLSPKKILGDVTAALLCNHFQTTDRRIYSVSANTKLIVAGWASEEGSQTAKVEKVLLPWIRSLPAAAGGIFPANVDILVRASLEDAIDELKTRIGGRLNRETHL